MTHYDGPSFLKNDRPEKSADNAKEPINFRLNYEKTMPEDLPERLSQLKDSYHEDKQVHEYEEKDQKHPLSSHTANDAPSPLFDEYEKQNKTKRSNKQGFRPTYIPSIYKNKEYISPDEHFDNQKIWYEQMSERLDKKPNQYILPESAAKKIIKEKPVQTTSLNGRKNSTP